MARAAITYEQVAAVANALYAAGNHYPGGKVLRQELEKQRGPGAQIGSLSTIQRHLDHWREHERPRDARVPVPPLPDHVKEALDEWVNKSRVDAQRPLEADVDRLKAELQDTVVENESLTAQLEQLGEDTSARTSERDAIRGELSTRTSEIAELKSQLTAARQRIASLERDVTAAHTNEQAAMGRVDEIRVAADKLEAKLAISEVQRNQAREERAAAQAALQGEKARADAAEAREISLGDEIKQLRERVNQSALAGVAAARALAAASERATGCAARVQDLQRQLERLQSHVPSQTRPTDRSEGKRTRKRAAKESLGSR